MVYSHSCWIDNERIKPQRKMPEWSVSECSKVTYARSQCQVTIAIRSKFHTSLGISRSLYSSYHIEFCLQAPDVFGDEIVLNTCSLTGTIPETMTLNFNTNFVVHYYCIKFFRELIMSICISLLAALFKMEKVAKERLKR
jgi:hypothetical protein